jgi:signal transduction histidine kinase
VGSEKQLRPLLSHDIVQFVESAVPEQEGAAQTDCLLTYAAAPGPDGRRGAVEVIEATAGRHAFAEEVLPIALFSDIVVAVVSGVISVLLAMKLIGRPISQLVRLAQSIGSGSLGQPLSPQPNDDLGQLATELHLMARQLNEARRRSEADVAARIQAVEQLRHSDRLSTLGHLASSLAHELGTPLNVVIGNAQLIVKGRVAGDQVIEGAATIVEQGQRMEQLIRQMLDYARRPTPKSVPTNLADIMHSTVELVTPLANQAQVELCPKIELEEAASTVADPVQIQQVLTNLILNAIQASSEGQAVEVRLSSAVTARNRDPNESPRPWLVLSVVDRGCGISPQDLPRVFEPFFTTKSSGCGTGLGLTIAEEVVRQHDGWISVASGPGEGTRFDIYLPRSEWR